MVAIINRLWTAVFRSRIILSHSSSFGPEIDEFLSFFKEEFQSKIKEIIERGQSFKQYYDLVNDVKIEYCTIGSESTGACKLTIVSCPLNKVDKLFQLFADETMKLVMQKEIFKEI